MLEFEVKCECGQYLDTYVNRSGIIEVTPCSTCIDSARGNGFEDGYEAGQEKGYDEGHTEGEKDGSKTSA